MSSKYQGKVVVITGASSGFGKGTALELAKLGCSVVLAARSDDTLEALALECDASGGHAHAVPTDVSDRSAVEKLAAEVIGKFGHFDVWINDAGVAAIGRFDVVPLEDHDQVIKTDLLGTIYGSLIALRHFRERNGGILLNIASAIGKIPAPLYASYTAAKFGIVGLCDAIRGELGEEKIETIRLGDQLSAD
jgi:NADP-dependent 3-hydroxy acid dehydrogenase YdfG